jgi:hypothetical protein
MLSGETSVGQYPIEAVRTLTRIMSHMEKEASLSRRDLRQAVHLQRRVPLQTELGPRRSGPDYRVLTSSGFGPQYGAFRPDVGILPALPTNASSGGWPYPTACAAFKRLTSAASMPCCARPCNT